MSKVFFIDETKCTGCKACVVTCKDKCGIDAGMNLRTVTTEEDLFLLYESAFIPDPAIIVRTRHVLRIVRQAQ